MLIANLIKKLGFYWLGCIGWSQRGQILTALKLQPYSGDDYMTIKLILSEWSCNLIESPQSQWLGSRINPNLTGGYNIKPQEVFFCNRVEILTQATSYPLEAVLLLQRPRQVCTDQPPASATQQRGGAGAARGLTRPVVWCRRENCFTPNGAFISFYCHYTS